MGYKIAIVGATGNVGSRTLNVLHERNFPIDDIIAVASPRSHGRLVSFGDRKTLKVHNLETFDFRGVDIAFFSAGSDIARKYSPAALEAGAIVIDKSSCFRMNPEVPLIVPEVNGKEYASKIQAERPEKGVLISNPNCTVIPLALALHSILEIAPIKQVVVTTLQSVSGAGKKAMDELFRQSRKGLVTLEHTPTESEEEALPPIAFNVRPHIGDFTRDKATDEEVKLHKETNKILGQNFPIYATCVRVPVFIGHCLSVYVECENPIDLAKWKESIRKNPALNLITRENMYATPVDCVGLDEVFVSRVRRSPAENPNTVCFWLTLDNLLKGAALNAVQIAEQIIENSGSKI